MNIYKCTSALLLLSSNIAQHIKPYKQLGEHPRFSMPVWLSNPDCSAPTLVLAFQIGSGTPDWPWHIQTGPGIPDWPWHPRLALAPQTGHGTSRLALVLAPQTASKFSTRQARQVGGTPQI